VPAPPHHPVTSKPDHLSDPVAAGVKPRTTVLPAADSGSRPLKLGVNVDHVATLREARYRGLGHGEPDPVEAALECLAAGAHGITAHLREDRRHIQDRDIWRLREVVRSRLNLEMTNTPDVVDIACRLRPDIACIVPERRQEVTTEGGLDAAGQEGALAPLRRKLNDHGIEVSLFIAPDPRQIEAAARLGSQCIEIHTGALADHFADPAAREHELDRIIAAAGLAHAAGLKVNAGHGLNYQNLSSLDAVPHLVELNIGHSIISRAVLVGLAAAVREMLQLMARYRG
jgi:pyridoxine 5-phosphate synthase